MAAPAEPSTNPNALPVPVWSRYACAVLFLLAGCAQQAPAPSPAVVPEVENPIGGFEFSAEGAAGDWLVVFHPVEFDRVIYEVHFDAEARGDGRVQLFGAPPALLPKEEGPRSRLIAPFLGQAFAVGEAAVQVAQHASIGTESPSGFEGFLMAVAADAPWSVQVTVRWDEGNLGAPRHVWQGSGASLQSGGQRMAGLPTAPAGSTRLEATVETPGWTHLEVLRDPLQPLAWRDYDVAFPNGHSFKATTTNTGAWAGLFASARSGGPDYLGTMQGVAGDVRAALTYAQADTGADWGLVHMPVTGLPEFLGDYQGILWPFPTLS
jgi:hypothetical protein